MNSVLCLSVRLLDFPPAFHGQSGDGEPEWPPSPLRLFQALVATAGSWRDESSKADSLFALKWFERQPPPQIVAPSTRTGVAIRIAVPNNDMNSVLSAWAKGLEPSKQPSELKTLKTVRPTRPSAGDDEPAKIYYLWSLSGTDFDNHAQALSALVRRVTHLGWGIDMVAANASVLSEADTDDLPGERWHPIDSVTANELRVSAKGTLDALIDKHDAFLGRLGLEEYSSVPPLTTFRIVSYRRTTEPPHHPSAAFSLRVPEMTRFRPFNSATWGVKVAGMLRHVVKLITESQGWPEEKVARFVLGHGEPKGQSPAPVLGPRLAFIPLPTIAPRGQRGMVIESVRRILITVLNGEGTDEIRDLERLLPGVDLISEHERKPIARIARLSQSDDVLTHYCGEPSATWATVTPVILPGFDDPRKLRKRLHRQTDKAAERPAGEDTRWVLDKLDKRVDDLLRKAIRQAGFAEDLARFAEIEWRSVGFWPGTEHAIRYLPPEHLQRFRRLHVRITWRDKHQHQVPIPGPICLGGGRFCGLGLFAAIR